MLTTTMQSVIEGTVNVDETRDHYLYLVRDHAVVEAIPKRGLAAVFLND